MDTPYPAAPSRRGIEATRYRQFDRELAARPDWITQASCRNDRTLDPDLFFPVKDSNYAANREKARNVCRRCPVQMECLDYAMATTEDGIWGGLTRTERDQLRADQRAIPIVAAASTDEPLAEAS